MRAGSRSPRLTALDRVHSFLACRSSVPSRTPGRDGIVPTPHRSLPHVSMPTARLAGTWSPWTARSFAKLSEGDDRVDDPGFSPDGKFVVFWANAGLLRDRGFDGATLSWPRPMARESRGE